MSWTFGLSLMTVVETPIKIVLHLDITMKFLKIGSLCFAEKLTLKRRFIDYYRIIFSKFLTISQESSI